jgi:hypothetical protein
VQQWVPMLGKSCGKDGKPLAPATVHKAHQILQQIRKGAVLADVCPPTRRWA